MNNAKSFTSSIYKYILFISIFSSIHAQAHVDVRSLINGKWQVIQRECSGGTAPFDSYDLLQDIMTYSFSESRYLFNLVINSRKLVGGRSLCRGKYEGDLDVVPYPQRATDGIVLKKSDSVFNGVICPNIPDREFAVMRSDENSILLIYPAPELCFGMNSDLVLRLKRVSEDQ